MVAEQLDVATVFTREWRYLEGEHRDEIVAERRRYEERWRALFREGVESGDLRTDLDVGAATLLVLSAANWAYTWLEPGRDTDELADRFTGDPRRRHPRLRDAAVSALLIVNPFASGVDEHRLAAVQAALPEGTETRLTTAAGRGDRDRPRGHGRVDAIYVFGGDGTYNEVLNGIEADVPLGFLPGGGTSVLPRALGLPRNPVKAAQRVCRGHDPADRARACQRPPLRLQRGARLRRGARPQGRRARTPPGREAAG